MTKTLIAALAVAILASGPVTAREFTADEMIELEAAVADFNAAFAERDWAAVISVVPPKIIGKVAADNNVTVENLLPQMVTMMEESLAVVTIESYDMPLDQATYGEGTDGTPYALIPTATVISLGEQGKMKSSNTTIGFSDEGEWYLVRGDDAATLAILREVYPAFAELELPEGSMEIVKE